MTLPTTKPRRPRAVIALFCCLLSLGAAPLAARTPRARRATRGTPRETLSGSVVDPDGTPIEGARVLVVELDRAVRTNDAGRFSIPGIASGTYTLEVRRIGYRTEVLTVDLPGSGAVRVVLESAPFPLEPLNVTVARGPLSPGSSPLPASVLGPQDLERDRSVSLAQTLEHLPGVRTLSTGREIGKPVIRGLSGARVLVLSQGLRLEDYAWSDEDGPAVDPAMADRIEVIRGPASVLYGADAVGGVVNVVPRPLPDAAGGASFVRGDGELSFATNNREAGAVVRGEGASGPWGWRVAADGRFAEALHTPVGELENTGFGAFNAEGALVRRGAWGSLTTRFVHNGGEFKLLEEDAPPGGDAGREEEAGPERKLMDDRLQLLGIFPMGGLTRLETRVQLQRHNIIEMEDDPDSAAVGVLVEVPIFDLTLTTGLGEALLHHALTPNTSGTIGVTGKLQSSGTDGVVPVVPGASQSGAGAFLLERLDRGPLTVLGGVRTDLADVDADGFSSRSFQAFTWSAGAAWSLADGVSLTANAGTAWRAPTLFELYASGPRLGEARYEYGDATLDEERSFNLDGGLNWRVDRVRGHVAAYRNDFTDFLYIQPTDRTVDGYQVFEYRQADALLTGGEASLEIDAAPWLTLTGKGDYVRGTNETRDEPLPLMPPRRIVAGAEVHGAWPDAESWAYVGGEVESVAAPERLNPYDYDVGGYTLVHVSGGLRGTLMGRDAALELRVRNLAGTEYKDFLSRYKRFALNPGRDVVLRLRMGF